MINDRAPRIARWHSWYAWHPVTLRDGTVVWMERVMRRYVDVGRMWTEMSWQYAMTEEDCW